MSVDYPSQFAELIRSAAKRHNVYSVFKDFCAMTANSFYNVIFNDPEKEKEYLSIAAKYEKKELDCFPTALAVLMQAFEEEVSDILGNVYQDLGANSKSAGQFFTPYHLCDLLVNMNVLSEDLDKALITTIDEPACGSGAMVLPLCTQIRKHPELNNKVIIYAGDLDITCVHMAYIQLTLAGANAIVRHANALSKQPPYSVWPTLSYVQNREILLQRLRAQELLDIFSVVKRVIPAKEQTEPRLS